MPRAGSIKWSRWRPLSRRELVASSCSSLRSASVVFCSALSLIGIVASPAAATHNQRVGPPDAVGNHGYCNIRHDGSDTVVVATDDSWRIACQVGQTWPTTGTIARAIFVLSPGNGSLVIAWSAASITESGALRFKATMPVTYGSAGTMTLNTFAVFNSSGTALVASTTVSHQTLGMPVYPCGYWPGGSEGVGCSAEPSPGPSATPQSPCDWEFAGKPEAVPAVCTTPYNVRLVENASPSTFTVIDANEVREGRKEFAVAAFIGIAMLGALLVVCIPRIR